ncbi:acyclic terpene utilization AtuA family protein [Desulfogranum mediterraneum]|uniref:acyclic terpene utilization AtuA family protein n=1 Tax=Desulfogranum mediterraneum TaxID=160661 RepID=UPI000419DD3D|nr:acyclic terpene utilization AtuA family protein [Desulfogranum mediterraneum]
MKEKIVIANAGGFWGDEAAALRRQLEGGPIDYLTMDYLAEITMIILSRQLARDPGTGYAADFLTAIGDCLQTIHDRRITVITNAGGMNPQACARALEKILNQQGLELPIATVSGDNLLPELARLVGQGHDFPHLSSGQPLGSLLDRLVSANAYLGARPIVEALGQGARVIITGRCYDAASVVAPFVHEFGWNWQEYDKLAGALLAGHLIECGSQSTGGNCSCWQEVPSFLNMGYPLVEAAADGSFVLTKHPGTGGMVTLQTAKEQLLYEIGDPRAYICPDVVADFTTPILEQLGPDRVGVRGVKGQQPPAQLKVSVNYRAGYKVSGLLVVSGPEALAKGRIFAEMFWDRVGRDGLLETRTDYVGYSACWGESAAPEVEPNEILLRFSARGKERSRLELLSREVAGLILAGPPGVTVFGGRPPVVPAYGYWPTLVERSQVTARLELAGEELQLNCDQGACGPPRLVSREKLPAGGEGRARVRVPLGRIAHARSGDKGDLVNIGVAARTASLYPELLRELTPERLSRFFASNVHGPIERFRLDNLAALNFVLHQALGGGGTVSLLLDNQGKTLAQALLTMEVEVDPELLAP